MWKQVYGGLLVEKNPNQPIPFMSIVSSEISETLLQMFVLEMSLTRSEGMSAKAWLYFDRYRPKGKYCQCKVIKARQK